MVENWKYFRTIWGFDIFKWDVGSGSLYDSTEKTGAAVLPPLHHLLMRFCKFAVPLTALYPSTGRCVFSFSRSPLASALRSSSRGSQRAVGLDNNMSEHSAINNVLVIVAMEGTMTKSLESCVLSYVVYGAVAAEQTQDGGRIVR